MGNLLHTLPAARLLNHARAGRYSTGSTPSSWWVAVILPIEKPGKQHEFRPISLTNVITRFMQKSSNKVPTMGRSVFPEEQAGFGKYRSCEEHIAGLTDDMDQAI